jgi:hypothetical protein
MTRPRLSEQKWRDAASVRERLDNKAGLGHSINICLKCPIYRREKCPK